MNNNNFLYLPAFYFDKDNNLQSRVKVEDDIIIFYKGEYITKKVLSLKIKERRMYVKEKNRWFDGFYLEIKTDNCMYVQEIYYDEGLLQVLRGTSIYPLPYYKNYKFDQDIEFKVKNLRKQKFAFSKALSNRLGSNSPARFLSPNLFEEIMGNKMGGNGNKEYIKLQSGGKRLIRYGKRGGRYYMKGGNKVYINK